MLCRSWRLWLEEAETPHCFPPPAPSLMCTRMSCISEEGEVFFTVLQAHHEQSFGLGGCSAIHCLLWGISVSNESPASYNCCLYTITEKPASTWPNILSLHLLIATGPYSCARGYSYWKMLSCSDKNCNTGIWTGWLCLFIQLEKNSWGKSQLNKQHEIRWDTNILFSPMRCSRIQKTFPVRGPKREALLTSLSVV